MKLAEKISVIMLFLGFAGCGYHLLGKEIHLPGGVSKIYVEPARNQTMEAGLEQIFTQKLLEHLRADARIQLVNPDQAEAILRSELLETRDQPLAFDRAGRVTLERVELSARATLIAVKENQKLWDSGIIREREQYPVSDDFFRNDQLRRGALIQLSSRLSRTVVEMLASDF